MKKLLAIVVLGLLLVSCVAHDMERFKNQNINYKTGDVRVNVVEGDKNSVYVGLWVAESDYKIDEKGIDLGWLTDGFKDEVRRWKPTALKKCESHFKLEDLKKIKTWLTTKEEAEKYNLAMKIYDVYECKKSYRQVQLEKEEIEFGKINTLNRSFICSYEKNSNEKSKIKIRGGGATEITSIGVKLSYSDVRYTDKGAFVLRRSSDIGRTWFIGASSVLLLDNKPFIFNCR